MALLVTAGRFLSYLADDLESACQPDIPEINAQDLSMYVEIWETLKIRVGSYGSNSFDLDPVAKGNYRACEHWMKFLMIMYGHKLAGLKMARKVVNSGQLDSSGDTESLPG